MPDLKHFPKSYADARQRFLKLRETLTGPKHFDTWNIPSNANDDLAVDSVYLPPLKSPERLFVLLSGVHGLEAYAGHGIQSLFIDEVMPALDRSHSGIFIIHSLNPFGFKHHRRGTEANVNLNRNCSTHPGLYQIENKASLALSNRFIPKQPVNSERCWLLQQLKQQEQKIWFDDVSLDEFIKSVGLGQFESPAGLEYGGRQAEVQIEKMIAALREIMPAFKDIVLLDLHTGLGERGRLHLLTGDVDGCVHQGLFSEIFKPGEDRKVYDFTPADQEGFYRTHGATNNIFPELAAPGQRICAMTMEFGTLGHHLPAQLESLNQWLLEHQGSLYGYASPELQRKIQDDYLEKFFPSDPLWRRQILGTSRELFRRVFRRTGLLA